MGRRSAPATRVEEQVEARKRFPGKGQRCDYPTAVGILQLVFCFILTSRLDNYNPVLADLPVMLS